MTGRRVGPTYVTYVHTFARALTPEIPRSVHIDRMARNGPDSWRIAGCGISRNQLRAWNDATAHLIAYLGGTDT